MSTRGYPCCLGTPNQPQLDDEPAVTAPLKNETERRCRTFAYALRQIALLSRAYARLYDVLSVLGPHSVNKLTLVQHFIVGSSRPAF